MINRTLCSLGAGTALMLSALAGAEGMTLKQIADLRSVTAAEISPDGTMTAYTLSVPRALGEDEDGSAWTELHLLGADGVSRPFITGEVSVSSIGWSADGKAVTFLSKRPGDDNTTLYAIPLGGGEARAIASLETSISSYAMSPDGKSVALLAFEPEDKELKKEKDLGFDQYAFEEEWHPRRVYIQELGADGSSTDADPVMLEIEGSVTDLIDFLARQWTPDQQIVGLGLSFSEVVGALHELYKAGSLTASFATERDRLIADLLASADGEEIEVRPETPGDRRELVVFNERNLTPQVKPEEAREGGLLERIERDPVQK